VSQTAVEPWDKRWATSEGLADCSNRTRQRWRSCRNCTRAAPKRLLDLGCGFGRHALLLASTASMSRRSKSEKSGGH
jgi:hypothetical protein